MSSHKNRHTHWSYCLTATNEPWGGLWRNLETVESLKMWNISFKPEQHLLILTVKTQIIKIFLSESRCKNHRPCQNLHTWMDRFFQCFFCIPRLKSFRNFVRYRGDWWPSFVSLEKNFVGKYVGCHMDNDNSVAENSKIKPILRYFSRMCPLSKPFFIKNGTAMNDFWDNKLNFCCDFGQLLHQFILVEVHIISD